MVTASLVKELREQTGAGMMECKKALDETNGDLEAAIDNLRERGILKAGKKESRIAAEGLAKIFVKGDQRSNSLLCGLLSLPGPGDPDRR